VIRGFVLAIGLLAIVAPGRAHAQTNLDQGKSAAQIFAGACAECHKAAHGLANGKNSATLTDFLREHYTTSRDQAAALAAYVLGGRGAEPVTPGQGHPQKPSEPASASAEESKPAKHQGPHAAKPEEHPPAAAKLQRPGSETAKPEEEANPGEQPTIMSPDVRPTTASRSRRREPRPSPAEAPAAVAHVPAAVVTDPGPTETPRQEANPNPSPAAATPPSVPPGESGENPPLPRDDVPD
jgi:hypothetical protein